MKRDIVSLKEDKDKLQQTIKEDKDKLQQTINEMKSDIASLKEGSLPSSTPPPVELNLDGGVRGSYERRGVREAGDGDDV